MKSMYNKVKIYLFRLVTIITIIFITVGCRPSSHIRPSNNEPVIDQGNISGKLSVYSQYSYKAALSRVFRTLNMQYSQLDVQWTNDRSKADIIITDAIFNNETAEFRTLDQEAQDLEKVLIPNLIFRDHRGVVGLPLFLRTDCYWYDELFYKKAGNPIPLSIGEFMDSPLRHDFPAIYDRDNAESIFWSTLAPIYLSLGGNKVELENASFQLEPMSGAFRYLYKMGKHKILIPKENAYMDFLSNNTMFWNTDFTAITDIRNRMPNLSKLGLSPTLIYDTKDLPNIILRADIVAVKKTTDKKLSQVFLSWLFDNKTLVNLAVDSKVPLACKISYGYNSIPELTNTSLALLSSPSLNIIYLSYNWDYSIKTKISDAINNVLNFTLSPEEASRLICDIE